MSLLDELQQEVAKRNEIAAKRTQIEALRKQAQDAFNTQFLLDASNTEKITFLKGRIAAFDECLQLFMSEEEQGKEQGAPKWDAEDE